ncbi:MAG: Exodeoxyribonuclease III [Elusimicrobia bacterium]|nr:Exodeoxyribonuclease III [Elusimicrobiota bacterium]
MINDKMNVMKIATFNVNSIRKRLPIVTEWITKNQPDVMCLQETKVEDKLFPLDPLQNLGYHVTFRGMKAYNGVATLSKEKPSKVVYGLKEGPDSEDFRIIQTVIYGIPIFNTYIPQGYLIDSPKYQYKLTWFQQLRKVFEDRLNPSKPALWLGDLNVAPSPLDVHHPERHKKHVCYHELAQEAYKNTVSWGFVDVFRKLYPDRVQYTFWDFFGNSFANNRGWRIDHILATAPLANRCTQVEVDLAPRQAPTPSDHTVVWAEFKLP